MTVTLKELRVHLGAHKSATTHVQETLGACQPQLHNKGVDYIPLESIRPEMKALMSSRNWRFVVGGMPLRDAVLGMLQRVGSGAGVVAFSEENILGSSAELLGEVVYPRLRSRLKIVRAMSKVAPVSAFLSIRSFDRVLPGAYVTALRFGEISPMDRTRLEDAWGRHSPSWVEVIDRIVGVLPGVPLRIWQQEVYAENAPYVLNQFVGVEIADIPSIAPPKSTMTPSAQAVQAAESFVRSFRGSRSDLTAAVDRIYASMPVSESESRFTLVDDQQRRQMRKQYDRDIEIIQRRWPGALIRP